MRDRKKQRENRRKKEDILSMRNGTGVLDPTPYYAVKNICKQEKNRKGA